MHWRCNELAHFGDQLTWLDQAEAAGVFDQAMHLASTSHYGLDPATVADIERLDIEEPGSEPHVWLAYRIGGGTVLVALGRDQVFRMDGTFFVRNWQDMLMPSRDDAVILPEGQDTVLFYCHEDEFEFGRQRKV